MAGRLRDRFESGTYDGDEPVHLFRADKYGTNDGGVWMPERIWHRVRWLATAYELHLLPLLDGSTDPVFLNAKQVEQLLEELIFVGDLVDDPLVSAQVQAVISLSAERSDGASKDTVGIEFP